MGRLTLRGEAIERALLLLEALIGIWFDCHMHASFQLLFLQLL